MRSHTVGEVMRPAADVMSDRTPIGDTVQYFLQHEVVNAYVTDAQDRLVGTISIHDIKDPEVRDLGPVVIARDIVEPNVHSVRPADTLAECMDHFVLSEHDELPVVETDHRLIGTVSRRDVLRVYSSELLRHEYLGVTSGKPESSGVPRALRLASGLTVARVRTPRWLAGRSLRDADLRAAYRLTVVAVQRGGLGEDQLPQPEVPLGGGDILVVVGQPADIERLRRPAPGDAVAS